MRTTEHQAPAYPLHETHLRQWLTQVVGDWRDRWADDKTGQYSDVAAFIGDRLISDFGLDDLDPRPGPGEAIAPSIDDPTHQTEGTTN